MRNTGRRQSVEAQAQRLSRSGERGWLTPDGVFFEADETPAIRIVGLELGGHERAALKWLEENRRDLLDCLEDEAAAAGYQCWEEMDGKDLIKNFMFEHGFHRVAPE
jgi:hypothetical protein